MAFDIRKLFGLGAQNLLLQPAQSANGVQNMLMTQPGPTPAPVAPSQAMPAIDPQTTAAVAGPAPVAPQNPVQVAQAAPPSQGFGFGIDADRKAMLNDFFLGLAMGQSPEQSLALGAAQASKGKGERRSTNQTVDWLKKRGLAEDEAKMLASSPSALGEYVQQIYKPKKDDSLINAGGSLYNRETGEWITPPAGASRPTEYGLNLVYGKDKTGKTVAYQLSKDGTYKPFEPPQGIELTPGIVSNDLGTNVITRNKATGEIIDTQKKDVAGQAAEEKFGTSVGEAQAAIPAAEMTANMVGKQIQELKDDPYLDRMVGSFDSRLPNISSDAARVQGRMNQLQGGAFLQARQMLKGGGAITDYEGVKAEDAYARLQVAQNETDYRKALDDFNEAVQIGLRKLQRQAGQVSTTAAAPAQSASGGPVRRYNPETGRIE
jgi:hypothetical protein